MGIVIGITGGIATGKSTVARMFEQLGAEILDADVLAREVLAPGSPGAAEAAQVFGSEIIADDGSIDRKRLADIVFNDPEAREKLNAITHPRIIELLSSRISRFRQRSGPCDVMVVEIPLLIEVGLTGLVDKIALVYAEQEAQQNRLRKRSNLSSAEINGRIRSQMPLRDKIPYADWVINNDCSLEETQSQVVRVWEAIRCPSADSSG